MSLEPARDPTAEAARAQLHLAFEMSPLGIAHLSLDGHCLRCNPRLCRMLGRAEQELVGLDFRSLSHPDERGDADERLAALLAGRSAPVRVEKRYQHRDGHWLWVAVTTSLARGAGGGEDFLISTVEDVDDRARAEQREQIYQTELALLNRRLLDQEKQTTRALAQALHDGLGQTLAALRMHCDANKLRIADAGDGGALAEALAPLDRLITLANQQVRTVLTDLRPPLLDELGLGAALGNELHVYEPLEGGPELKLHVTLSPEDVRYPADVEFAAFMIAREAVHNAVRHAHAHAIDVAVSGGPGLLDLCIADDGSGLGSAPAAARPGHLGLVGMRERALAVGASLRIEAADGHGTRVRLAWGADTADPAAPLAAPLR
jgi:PAS domain S-box-containing protein